ncbi:MAG: glycosyltransferase [Patescibacteria group bacterium]|nr:glycosyltransferase [Patescibacteria group bacterium]
MKLCLINSLYEPYSRGGAEVVFDTVVKEFLKLNYEVVVITLGRKKEVVRQNNLTIYRIKPVNVFSFLDINSRPIWLRIFWHPLDVFNLSSYFSVKKILKIEKPVVVMTHNLKGLGYLIPLAIKSLKLRHWHTIHDVQLSRPSGLIIFGQEKPFLFIDMAYEKIVRWLFGSPEIVISPSNWLLDYYKVRGFFHHSKKIILPNPIIFLKVKKQDEKVESNIVTFIFVGQVEQSKGILFLIEALKKVRQSDWRLQIVGSGRAENEAKRLAGDDARFEFIGRVPPGILIEHYRNADFTVVPSLCYENSPKVIDESLAANVPVIAADIGGVSERVKDDYNGFTFAPANEKNLIEVLEYFLTHQQDIERLKKNCFVSVHNLSASSYLKHLLGLL